MATITLRLNTAQTDKALRRLQGKAAPAIARALNRGAVSARAVMQREIARDLGLKVGVVREALQIQTAYPKAAEIIARVWVSGKPIPLYDFAARGPMPSRGRGQGVTARLKGGAGRYPHAFIARMKSGHMGVFERVPGARRHGAPPTRPQLPIYELHGPSLPHVFAKYLPLGLARGQEAVTKNLEHELAFALQQAATP